jgi:hypothetical protein
MLQMATLAMLSKLRDCLAPSRLSQPYAWRQLKFLQMTGILAQSTIKIVKSRQRNESQHQRRYSLGCNQSSFSRLQNYCYRHTGKESRAVRYELGNTHCREGFTQSRWICSHLLWPRHQSRGMETDAYEREGTINRTQKRVQRSKM